MASFVPENVAAEKMDAMSKFERRRYFWKFLPAIEVVVAVLLLLYLLTPSLLSGEYLRRIISGGLISNGIFLFGVVNVLIALIFSLSNNQKLLEHDLYFQYVSSSSSVAPIGDCSSSALVSESSASVNEEKTSDIVKARTTDVTSVTLAAEEAQPIRKEMVRAVSSVTETADAIRRKHEMTSLLSTTTESSNKDHHQVYRRSRSETGRFDKRREFRGSMRRLCEMDDLSSDEFRSTVETFIAGKKKMLSKEWLKP